MERRISRYAAPLLLGGILLIATFARVYQIHAGLPSFFDPDEPMFLLNGLRLLQEGTLNPGWFGHPGSTTIYTLASIDLMVLAVDLLSGRHADAGAFAADLYRNPGIVVIPSRLFIAFCGVAGVWMTWWIGERLFDRKTGLLAAALLALNPLHAEWSQIVRTDVHSSLFMLASLIFAIRIAQRGRTMDVIVAGIFAGFACATKWPAVTILSAGAGACVLRAMQHGERGLLVRRLALLAAASGAGLVAASPFIVLDYPTLLRSVRGELAPNHLGASGEGLWRNMGWYLGTTIAGSMGVAGLALALWGAIQSRRVPIALATLLPATLVFFLLLASQSLRWTRWIVPLLPFASLFAAYAVHDLGERARRFAPKYAMVVSLVLVAVLLVPVAFGLRSAMAERRQDTRALAESWVAAHATPGSAVLVEYFAIGLLKSPVTVLFPAGSIGCLDGGAALDGRIQVATTDGWRRGRGLVDIGTLNPAKLDTCRADYAIFTDYDRYLAEAPRYRAEIAIYQKMLNEGRLVATYAPVPGERGGPVVRVVELGPHE